MTSSRKTRAMTAALLPYAPLVFFAVLWIHGATLGLTDDEAYYWVLAQKPALGYAFHPPATAWIIRAVQSALGWLLGESSAAVVRFGSCAMAAAILAISLRWVSDVRARAVRSIRGGQASVFWADVFVVLSLAGVFGASWMMVPDLPLFLGWAMAFWGSWKLVSDPARVSLWRDLAWLGFGTLIAVLSKFSGIMVAGCAGIVLLVWGRRRIFWMGTGVLVAAVFAGLTPTLIWNSQNDWQPLLYQFHERHSGGLSWVRYGRFWLIQLILAGPLLLAFSARMILESVRHRSRMARATEFAAIWAIPHGLVYCVQPLWAEFKPHWALIVWLPMVLLMAARRAEFPRWSRAQAICGVGIALLAAVFCHVSLISVSQPTWDVSNDMYGWSGLRDYFKTREKLPVVGSRYQTASQAAAALHGFAPVTLLPRDQKQLNEWPDIGVSDTQGPLTPRLLAPVYFVGDNRYPQGPGFVGAKCESLPALDTLRAGRLAKRILIWRCGPVGLK